MKSSSNSNPDYLVVGVVLRPQGLKGEVKVKIILNNPPLLLSFTEAMINSKETWTPIRILKSHIRDPFWFVTFAGIDSRNKAEEIRDCEIMVPIKTLTPLDENTFYHYELSGLEVINGTGVSIGMVEEVVNHPAVDYLLLKGAVQKLIPLSKSVIEKIDRDSKRIYLKVNL